MADFKQAFDKTMNHEGGYANDPDDVGGETYRGIARRYHPGWLGWDIIDDKKNLDRWHLRKDIFLLLDPFVQEFYQDNFWNPMLLDEVQSQAVAEEMFDTGVNQDKSRAVTYLQMALNVMNCDNGLFFDLVVDGRMGPKTLQALNVLLKWDGDDELLVWMNVAQGWHYMEYMKKSPIQEKYARGWAKRVQLRKK